MVKSVKRSARPAICSRELSLNECSLFTFFLPLRSVISFISSSLVRQRTKNNLCEFHGCGELSSVLDSGQRVDGIANNAS